MSTPILLYVWYVNHFVEVPASLKGPFPSLSQSLAVGDEEPDAFPRCFDPDCKEIEEYDCTLSII